MKVINLFAGPGAGKSTMAADVFAQLKWAGVNCEIAREWIKEKVWQGWQKSLSNQMYVFAKQHNALYTLDGQVTVAITDSPLPLSLIYDTTQSPLFAQLVLQEFHKFDNINYLITREKHYNPAGRMQTLDEAKDLDSKIAKMLEVNKIAHYQITGNRDGVDAIVSDILNGEPSVDN